MLLLIIGVIVIACNKEEVTVGSPNAVDVQQVLSAWVPDRLSIVGNVIGVVQDEAGEPVVNAKISLEDNTVFTDFNGLFFFEDVDMNSRGTYLQVEKNGYFKGSRRFFPEAAKNNRVEVRLIQKEFTNSFSAQNESEINLNGGARILFPENSVSDAAGNLYSGNVNVAAKWLDPNRPETFLEMPGNLQGVNRNSEDQILKTLGMVVVELEDDAGNDLNIAAGKTAEVSFPVPTEMQDAAPEEIPLWSFNEEYGIWVEEGTAVLNDNFYVGQVSHFSYWNCDIPTEYIYFNVKIVGETGQALEGRTVRITSQDYGTGFGITDSEGYTGGIIPANEILGLEVMAVECSIPVYSTEIGPFSENTDLGVIQVPNGTLYTNQVQGSFIDCDGNQIQNGYALINANGAVSYYEILNGQLNTLVTLCSAPQVYTLQAFNLDDFTQTGIIELSSTAANNTGVNQICGETQDFLTLTVGSITESYFVTTVEQSITVDTSRTLFSGNEGANFNFEFLGVTEGEYPGTDNSFTIIDEANSWVFYGWETGFSDFQVTESGGKLIGEFSGNLINYFQEPGTEEFVQGTFSITPE